MQDNKLNIDEITFGENLENVEYFERKAVYGIAINEEEKIATIKTPRGYFLPGGGIEENESHEACLNREFMEETGFEIKIGNYIGRSSLYHISKTYRYVHGIGFFYFVELTNKKNKGIEEDHTLKWIDTNECINKLFLEHQSWAVKKAMSMKKTNERHSEILQIVQKKLTCSAHNLDHVMRVYNLCMMIAKYEENVDLEVLIPAALLHDIARVEETEDKTGKIDHAVLGSELASSILKNLGYDKETTEKIKHCIIAHRYRTGNEPNSIEAKILFDADKIDAIGTVGVARTFMLSGQSGQRLTLSNSVEEYLTENTTENGRIKDLSKHSALIEYEVKLKKIPNKLYTAKAKEIGNERIKFMDEFFEKLKLELSV